MSTILSVQKIEMYEVTAILTTLSTFDVVLTYDGGLCADGEEQNTFANMADALAQVAQDAKEMESEESASAIKSQAAYNRLHGKA